MKRTSNASLLSSATSIAKNFVFSVSVGFFIGLGVVFYFVGPRGLRQQVCTGYSEHSKPLAIARAEKESYLESFMPRDGDVIVEVVQPEGAGGENNAALPVAGQEQGLPATGTATVQRVEKKVSRYRKLSKKTVAQPSKASAQTKSSHKKSVKTDSLKAKKLSQNSTTR